MKTKAILIVSIVAMLSFSALAQTNPAAGPTDNTAITNTGTVPTTTTNMVITTNAPPVPAPSPSIVPDSLKPIFDLLGGKGPWLTTFVIWVMTISTALASFAVWLRNKIADWMNRIAESSDTDDDEKLRSIFSNGFYRFIAFAFNFINIRFPTLAELERAIELQKEAAKEALAKAGVVTSEPKV